MKWSGASFEQDLSSALDESTNKVGHQESVQAIQTRNSGTTAAGGGKRRVWRRRCKSTSNLAAIAGLITKEEIILWRFGGAIHQHLPRILLQWFPVSKRLNEMIFNYLTCCTAATGGTPSASSSKVDNATSSGANSNNRSSLNKSIHVSSTSTSEAEEVSFAVPFITL